MSMVERVARALCDDTMSRWRSPVALQKEPWREFIPAARAVIEAMRLDPSLQSESCSTDIVDAGRNAWMEWEIGPDDFKRANAATVESWNEMITAALGKEE